MTPTELIDLLVEAQMLVEESAGVFGWKPTMKKTEAFAKLVAAKEREACAKVCEKMTLEWEDQPEFARIEISTMMDCALAIRNRGEQA